MIRSIARKYFLTPNTLRYRIELRVLRELAELTKNRSLGPVLLDAGAGSGEMSLRMMKAGFCQSLIGVEPMEQNIQHLRRNYTDPRCQCFQARLDNLPVADASVDSVMSTQVFEHIPDHHAAAAEVARVIKPGGYALISTPHPPEIFPNEDHVRPGYTVPEMRELFEAHGLIYLHHRYFLALPTLKRGLLAIKLGKIGYLLPISWADCESKLSQEEIARQQPYGLACLFQKPA